MSRYLSDGRGACFVVEPSSCPLDPFESQLLTVTAYSDIWGQYTDRLICKVSTLYPLHTVYCIVIMY